MALFGKKDAAVEEAPVVMDANAETPAPETKAKKEKKNKQQFLEPNQMNFLTQYEIVVEGKKQNLDLKKILKPLIAVAVVVLAVFVVMEIVLLGMKAQTKSLNKYINDEQNVASYNEAIATKEKTDTVNLQKSNLEACMAAIDSYPNVGTAFFQSIATTATKNNVTVSSYGYANETGFLSMSCTGTTLGGISQFVRDLETLGLFTEVTYTGFSGTNESGYSFSISCVCAGDADAAVAVEEAPVEEVVE